VSEGTVDPRVILGLNAAAEDDMDARPSHHDGHDDHEHDDFDSVLITLPEQPDADALARRIASVAEAHNILRIKGYAAISGKPMRLLVQAVGARVRHQFDRPWRPGEPRRGQLVVIAEKGDVNRQAIEAVFAETVPAQ
jgi:cobalamin biosynthesis protein CobW